MHKSSPELCRASRTKRPGKLGQVESDFQVPNDTAAVSSSCTDTTLLFQGQSLAMIYKERRLGIEYEGTNEALV
jgi:hypothetical protein